MGSGAVGIATSLLYLAVFLPGFMLLPVTRLLKGATLPVCAVCMAAGLIIIALCPSEWSFCVGALLTGAGYGVFQPVIYDKTTMSVTSPRKATLALSFVLAANYLSIAVAPFVINGAADVLGQQGNERFPFFFTFAIMVLFSIVVTVRRKGFLYGVTAG